jgi:hypothetical protein
MDGEHYLQTELGNFPKFLISSKISKFPQFPQKLSCTLESWDDEKHVDEKFNTDRKTDPTQDSLFTDDTEHAAACWRTQSQ